MAEAVDYRERALRQTKEGVEVAVAVLGPKESLRELGLPLAAADIQPVWVSVENDTDQTFALSMPSIDPDYFSPSEAVYLSRYRWRRWRNRGADLRFMREAMRWVIPPKVGVAGFIHTNRVLGYKSVEVELIGQGKRLRFPFLVEVPGPEMDYSRLQPMDLDEEFGSEPVDLEGLRTRLRHIPLCTRNRKGNREGDPINLALVAPPRFSAMTLFEAGWLLTESTNLGSSWRTFRSFLLGRPYRHSPVSPLWALGRRHDAALQKIRWSINERNHLRTWRTPLRVDDKLVHLVQISRDIGVRLTRRARILTTHRIDPDVDNARNALLLDLARINRVTQVGWLRISEPSSPKEPRRNLTGDRWWSDGLRVVVFLTDGDAPAESITTLDWDSPPPL